MKTIFIYLAVVLSFISCGSNNQKITQAEFERLLAADSVSSIQVLNDGPAQIFKKPFTEDSKSYLLDIKSYRSFQDSLDAFTSTLSVKNNIHPRYNLGHTTGGSGFIFSAFPLIILFVWSIVLINLIILFLYAIIDILKNKFESDNDKLIWVLVVILVPIIGPILYIFIGKKQKLLKR